MSWYDSDFERRKSISAVNTGGGGTVDGELVIPAEWDEFWDEIDSAGNELRITSGDGYTLLTYDVDDGAGGAFNKTTRAGRIRIDGASVPAVADTVVEFWVYFKTSSAQGDGSSAVVIASPLTCYIERSGPAWMVMVAQPQRAGKTDPRDKFQKTTQDTIPIWVDVTHLLAKRNTPFAGRMHFEEPFTALVTAEDDTGTNAPTLFTSSACRWCEINGARGRRIYFVCVVTGGTSGTNYTVKITFVTRVPLSSSNYRQHQARFALRVLDIVEAA